LAENLGGVGLPERTPKMIGLQSLLETQETHGRLRRHAPGRCNRKSMMKRSKVRQWTEI